MASCAGVYSPAVGWTWPSIRPGMTVVPRASTMTSASARPVPISRIRPSSTYRLSASSSGWSRLPEQRVPMPWIRRELIARRCVRSTQFPHPNPLPPRRERGLLGLEAGQVSQQAAIAVVALTDTEVLLDGPNSGGSGLDDRDGKILLQGLEDVQDAPAGAQHVDAVHVAVLADRRAGVGVDLLGREQ